MAQALRLRQEKIAKPDLESAPHLPIAAVMVDTGVFHLDYCHDYIVPAVLSEEVQVGSRVQVSFNGIRREGVVYERREKPERAGRLLRIERALGPRLADQTMVDLVSACAARWACHPYDIWRFALPARTIALEKKVVPAPATVVKDEVNVGKQLRSYHFLPPHSDEVVELAQRCAFLLKSGNVLLLLPDEKNVEDFLANSGLHNVINISSSLPKSQRYGNYLSMRQAERVLYVGSRAAIFAPIPSLSAIVVHREISENYYEPRTPGWNVRDVALIRSEITGVQLLFTGYGPSSEMARLIDSRFVTFVDTSVKVAVTASQGSFGELLPSKILLSMKRALSRGSILLLVPKRGYATGVICSHCRNIAHHVCGGVITRTSLRNPFECASCKVQIPALQCHWCKKESFAIFGKGSARVAEEVGRALPNRTIVESNSERLLVRTEGVGKIVIATMGAQPIHHDGFSGVYLLEAERFLSGIDLRSIERSEEAFFLTLSRSSSSAERAIVIDERHPVVASLIKWNPKLLLVRSLREREEANLPPFVRSIVFDIPSKEMATFEAGVRKAISEGRLPERISIRSSAEKIRIEIGHKDAVKAIGFFHEFSRKRSTAGKKLYPMRIDPYELG